MTVPDDGTVALDQLLPVVYDELRRIAHRQLRARAGGGTLQTTGLVHEAYLRLVEYARARGVDRSRFLGLASVAMRQVLVDRAKARIALKRGGERRRITFDETQIAADDQPEALIQLHEALERLAAHQPRLARVVECRFFGGLTEEETAATMGTNVRTVRRDWVKVRMLLREDLES